LAHTVVPGESFTETILIDNTSGHLIIEPRAEFVFGSAFELVQSVPASIYNKETRTAVWSLRQFGPRERMQFKIIVRVRNDAASGIESVGRGRLKTDSSDGDLEFEAPTIEIGGASTAASGASFNGSDVLKFHSRR
jgi:hypothetical protein